MSTIWQNIGKCHLALLDIYILLGLPLAHAILLWASVAIMLFSFIMYLLRYRNIMNGARFN